eukprot:scaffold203_cov386-Prasinococcus_capsulatus_cf.AAC.9
MTDANVGALVVTDDAGTKMLGIITERDYLRKIVVQGRRSDSTRVKEIMTPENRLITVEPHVNVYDAMQIMTANRFRHIPVTTTGALYVKMPSRASALEPACGCLASSLVCPGTTARFGDTSS